MLRIFKIRSPLSVAVTAGVACIVFFLFSQREDYPEASSEISRSEVYVLPRLAEGNEEADFTRLERQIGRVLTEEEQSLYARMPGQNWRYFEDEIISFSIPKDPLLEVEVLTPESDTAISVVGSVVGTTDHQFERAYRLTVGPDKLPYGVILVSSADWFDEGICFCGRVAMKRMIVSDGLLKEFSLVASGNAKKVQVLSPEGLRAILFEWTHSAISQATYLEIGNSLRIKSREKRTREDWIAVSSEYRKPIEQIGWISKGDEKKTLEQILGIPEHESRGEMVFSQEERSADGSGWKQSYKFGMQHNRFTGFEEGWEKSSELEPLEGSLYWAKELAERSRVEEPVADQIFESFLAVYSGEDSPFWNAWCHVVSDLEDHGFRDVRVLPIIGERFLDPELNQNGAGVVLDAYEAEGRENLFVKRAEMCLEQREGPSPHLDSLWNLFAYLPNDHPEFQDLLRRSIAHSFPSFQADGVYRAHLLPLAEARGIAKKFSKSEHTHVRSMTEGLYRRIGTAADLPDLEQWLEREDDDRLRKELEGLIQTLEKETLP